MSKREWYFLKCIYLLMWKKKRREIKRPHAIANFLLCVLVCLCQKNIHSGWESTVKGRKYPVQTRCQTPPILIPSWFPAIFVDTDTLWKNTHEKSAPPFFLFPTYECLHNSVVPVSAGEFYSWINSGAPLKCSSLGSEDPSYHGHHSPKAFPIFSHLPSPRRKFHGSISLLATKSPVCFDHQNLAENHPGMRPRAGRFHRGFLLCWTCFLSAFGS